MSLTTDIGLSVAVALPLLALLWVLFAPRNRRRDPSTPGWRVVSRQFGWELRSRAMPEDRALNLAYRLIFRAVKVVRLDNDAAGTTMTLAEIRVRMEQDNTRDS